MLTTFPAVIGSNTVRTPAPSEAKNEQDVCGRYHGGLTGLPIDFFSG